MSWDTKLAYFITPKSGPMRAMETLLDVNLALSQDLPEGFLKRSHWREVGLLLVDAAITGDDADVRAATDRLLEAIEREGWMNRTPRPS